jgi:guanylate kinase
MYKIIALIGEAGSGKDTCLKALLTSNPAYHEIISCTTRPPREGEIDGVNYYFLTEKEFTTKLSNGEMLEWSSFNGWLYGTPISSLSKENINVGVFNPAGIQTLIKLKQINREEVETKVYYMRTSAKERLLRQLNREEDPDVEEIIRRFSADEKDFHPILYPPLDEKYSGIISAYEPLFFFQSLQNETPDDLTKVVEFINGDNLN